MDEVRVCLLGIVMNSSMNDLNGYRVITPEIGATCRDTVYFATAGRHVDCRASDIVAKNKLLCFVGMPCAGKSTLGREVARLFGWQFRDLDLEVEAEEGCGLTEIYRRKGTDYFLKREAEMLSAAQPGVGMVVAPGGSIVYSLEAMATLRAEFFVIHLDPPLPLIEARLSDRPKAIVHADRGIRRLAIERRPLYESIAHLQLSPGQASVETCGIAILYYISNFIQC